METAIDGLGTGNTVPGSVWQDDMGRIMAGGLVYYSAATILALALAWQSYVKGRFR